MRVRMREGTPTLDSLEVERSTGAAETLHCSACTSHWVDNPGTLTGDVIVVVASATGKTGVLTLPPSRSTFSLSGALWISNCALTYRTDTSTFEAIRSDDPQWSHNASPNAVETVQCRAICLVRVEGDAAAAAAHDQAEASRINCDFWDRNAQP